MQLVPITSDTLVTLYSIIIWKEANMVTRNKEKVKIGRKQKRKRERSKNVEAAEWTLENLLEGKTRCSATKLQRNQQLLQ